MLPANEEVLDYIKKTQFVNFSMIARQFNIKNATVSDLIAKLEKENLVFVQKRGGQKFVMVKGK